MFCKMKNIATLVLPCLFLIGNHIVRAQESVTLSEEAMFDDDWGTTEAGANSEVGNEISDSEQNLDAVATKNAENTKLSQEIKPVLAVTSKRPTKNETPEKDTSAEEDDILDNGVDDLFSQMSDIEKKTTILNLQLRKEKLQNEIEAVKYQRKQAVAQEKLKEEEAEQKRLDKIKEEERKKREELQRLRELDIKFEKLRQERVLSAYKNQMLEETQKWLAHDALFYKTIADLRQSKKDLNDSYKVKLSSLKNEATRALDSYNQVIEKHKEEVQNLNSQIDVLRNRIVSLEQSNASAENNPFASQAGLSGDVSGSLASLTTGAGEPAANPLAKQYAVTEIRGQGGELIAKLVNKGGLAFYVKKGTALQSGHVINEITSTYVSATKNFKNDYIYFSAGGILPEEIDAFEIEK